MRAEDLISQLSACLPAPAIIASEDPRYEKGRKVWNGMFDRRPIAIVRPETAAEIAAIVKIMVKSDLPLAVRGGGHSIPGLSTCDGGLVLDLSRMNAIRVGIGSLQWPASASRSNDGRNPRGWRRAAC